MKDDRDLKLSVTLIPGIGLGDALFFVPTLFELLELGYHVKIFSSALKQFLSLPGSHEILPTLDYDQKERMREVAGLNPNSFIFIQNDSPATCLLKDYPKSFLVGKKRYEGLAQASQIAADIRKVLPTSTLSQEKLEEYLHLDKGRKRLKIVAIHPFSSHENKNWPLRQFIEVAKGLCYKGYQPIFCLGPNEEKFLYTLQKHFTVWSCLPLNELLQNLSRVSLLLGTDSGLGHMASLVGTPTVSIFPSLRHGLLWHPAWSPSRIVSPLISLPGFLKKRVWKFFVTSYQVKKAAIAMLESPHV